MHKREIQFAMRIIRPAIYAVFGRQKLSLSSYMMINMKYDTFDQLRKVEGWFRLENGYSYYKIRIENNKVTYLSRGKLNV